MATQSVKVGFSVECGAQVTIREPELRLTKVIATVSGQEDGIVDWDGPDDTHNPLNWTDRARWTIIVAISAITFNQAMSSTIFAPGVPQAMRDLHSDSEAIGILLVSSYVIGLAVGPLFLCPLSELYGRVPLMHLTNFTFLIAAVICAVSPDIPVLMVFRLMMGMSTISLGGGYVADLMRPEDRARAMNVWTVGPVLVSPVVGPITGGFICQATSWRWTFGLVAMTAAATLVLCFAFLPETYIPRLLEVKAARLRQQTGNPLLRSKYDKQLTPWKLLRLSVIRPIRMLLYCPIIIIVSLFLAIAYSYMYLMFTTFTQVFETTYSFNSGAVGLSYLGVGIGCLIGQYAVDVFLKWYRKRQMERHGETKPEDQLPPLVAAGALMAIGLVWYGWSLEKRTHWIVPIIGISLCGVGISFSFLAVQTYLVEAYTVYAASALAANTLIRCIFGMLVPLAAPPLYSRLGLGWGNLLLGFLALLVTPASYWLFTAGKRIRNNPRFMPDL